MDRERKCFLQELRCEKEMIRAPRLVHHWCYLLEHEGDGLTISEWFKENSMFWHGWAVNASILMYIMKLMERCLRCVIGPKGHSSTKDRFGRVRNEIYSS